MASWPHDFHDRDRDRRDDDRYEESHDEWKEAEALDKIARSGEGPGEEE